MNKPLADAKLLVTGRQLITAGLFIVFYFSMKGGYYFLANRLQELGFLIVMILFAYGALVSALNVRQKDLRWSFWVLSTLGFLCYSMIIPAYLWSTHNGVAMAPSVMASREFLIALIAPTLWFLYRIGYDIEEIERIFMITCGVLVISYLFHYFRLDLAACFRSDNPTIKGMVTHDEWRGYRLKAPGLALFMASIMSPYLFFKEANQKLKAFWLLVFLLSVFSWSLLMARSAIAMMIAGVFFYHLWFAHKNRLGLFFIALPVLIAGMTYSTVEYFEVMKNTDGGVRYKSYTIAFDIISQYPLFGYGIQSAATVTEQQVFWSKFYSADIGIIGVVFKYGIIGGILYFAFLFHAIARAIQTNWLIKRHTGKCNIIFIAAIAKMGGDALKFLLAVDYIYIQGVLMICFTYALSAMYRHRYANLSPPVVAASNGAASRPHIRPHRISTA